LHNKLFNASHASLVFEKHNSIETYHIKDIFQYIIKNTFSKMSLHLKANCYGFAMRFRELAVTTFLLYGPRVH